MKVAAGTTRARAARDSLQHLLLTPGAQLSGRVMLHPQVWPHRGHWPLRYAVQAFRVPCEHAVSYAEAQGQHWAGASAVVCPGHETYVLLLEP